MTIRAIPHAFRDLKGWEKDTAVCEIPTNQPTNHGTYVKVLGGFTIFEIPLNVAAWMSFCDNNNQGDSSHVYTNGDFLHEL